MLIFKICPYTDVATQLTVIGNNKQAVIAWVADRFCLTRKEAASAIHKTAKGNYSYANGNYSFIKN
jgi:hypothetical protein